MSIYIFLTPKTVSVALTAVASFAVGDTAQQLTDALTNAARDVIGRRNKFGGCVLSPRCVSMLVSCIERYSDDCPGGVDDSIKAAAAEIIGHIDAGGAGLTRRWFRCDLWDDQVHALLCADMSCQSLGDALQPDQQIIDAAEFVGLKEYPCYTMYCTEVMVRHYIGVLQEFIDMPDSDLVQKYKRSAERVLRKMTRMIPRPDDASEIPV